MNEKIQKIQIGELLPFFYRTFPGVELDRMEEEIPVIPLEVRPNEDYCEMMFVGDLHIGHEQFSERQFAAYVDHIINNPHLKVVLMGDLLEIAELSGFLAKEKEKFKDQIQTCVRYLDPIADRITIMLHGNHEERYERVSKGAIDIMRHLALEIGCKDTALIPGPQRGQFAVVEAHMKRNGQDFYNYYPFYSIHGSTGSIINLNTQLKRMASSFLVPLLCHGHIHRKYSERYEFKTVSLIDGKFYQTIMSQLWVLTGCFLKYPGYAEEKSLPVSSIGAPIVRFYITRNALEYVDPRARYGIGLKESSGSGITSEIREKLFPLKELKETKKLLEISEGKHKLRKVIFWRDKKKREGETYQEEWTADTCYNCRKAKKRNKWTCGSNRCNGILSAYKDDYLWKIEQEAYE